MTISDSCNKLFLWFKENDYYNEKEDFLKLLPLKCGIRALEKAFKRSCEKASLLKNKHLI